jgi:hypothetical protein
MSRAMVSAPLTEDHPNVRFRPRSVQAGAAISVAAASAFPITDGGASSPLIAGRFLPPAFAALS